MASVCMPELSALRCVRLSSRSSKQSSLGVTVHTDAQHIHVQATQQVNRARLSTLAKLAEDQREDFPNIETKTQSPQNMVRTCRGWRDDQNRHTHIGS